MISRDTHPILYAVAFLKKCPYCDEELDELSVKSQGMLNWCVTCERIFERVYKPDLTVIEITDVRIMGKILAEHNFMLTEKKKEVYDGL